MHALYDQSGFSVLCAEIPKLVHSSVKYCLPNSKPAPDAIEMDEKSGKLGADEKSEKPDADEKSGKPGADEDCKQKKKPSSVRLL